MNISRVCAVELRDDKAGVFCLHVSKNAQDTRGIGGLEDVIDCWLRHHLYRPANHSSGSIGATLVK